MSEYHFNCPYCGQPIDAPVDMFGQLIECPSCKQTIEVAKTQANAPAPKYKTGRPPVNAAQKYSSFARRPNSQRGSDKKILPCFLLFLFFGSLGGHAFYAGKISIGVIYIIMLIAGFMISSIGVDITFVIGVVILLAYSIMLLVDFIRIIVGSYQDGDGNKISEWT